MKLKQKIKVWIFVFLLILWLNFSFAFTNNESLGGWDKLVNFFSSVVDFISAIWYIFPILAWKLLSNDLVYGSFLHMDVILWKIWNFSKTFANFVLGFLFIFYLFKYLTSVNDKNTDIIKNILPKIALWAIVVNLSWFIIGVLVDISTLLIAAAGNFSSSMGDNFYKNVSNNKLALTTQVTISSCKKTDASCMGGLKIIENTNHQKTVSLKDVLKYENNISGPLMFMGQSILDIYSTKETYLKNSFNNNSKKSYSKWALMVLFLRLLVMLLFIVPLVILIIVLIVRIFWLWIYIGFSPLIFLDQIFWGKVFGQKAQFKLSNMIWLIFQPVLVVFAFSISFIFLTWVFVVVDTQSSDLKVNKAEAKKIFWIENSTGAGIESYFYKIEDTTQTMSRYLGWFFGYLILILLTSAFVWWILKLSFKSSEVTASIAEKSFKFTEDILASVQVIPTPWWRQSIGSLNYALKQLEAYPWKKIGNQWRKLQEKFRIVWDITPEQQQSWISAINDLNLGNSVWDLTKEKINEIFAEVSRYSSNPRYIENNKKFRKVMETLFNKLQNYDVTDTNYRELLNKLKDENDFEQKFKYFVQHKDEFKKILLNEIWNND